MKKIFELEQEIDEIKNTITDLMNGFFIILSSENLRIFSKVKNFLDFLLEIKYLDSFGNK